MSQIGIKLANHDFFPIIESTDSLPVEKQIELTTMRDGQPTVQINLYKKDEETQEELAYVGTLIIEDLKDDFQGDATILLKLALDEGQHLTAQALDEKTGNKQSFGISLDDLSTNNLSTFDFELDEPVFKEMGDNASDISDIDLSFTDFLSDNVDQKEEDESLDSDALDNELDNDLPLNFDGDEAISTPKASSEESILDENIQDEGAVNESLYIGDLDSYKNQKSGFPKWLKIFLILTFISVLALVVALVLKNVLKPKKTSDGQAIGMVENKIEEKIEQREDNIDAKSIDSVTTQSPNKEKEPFEEKKQIKKDSEEDKNVNNKNEQEEVKEVKNEAIKKAVNYRLKWGDTLWDIADNFYQNPWKYKKIARYNGIKNPNRIIAGRYIIIPAK